jgi:pimeloyl-ACP methyl ester carboxylesterase
MTIRELVRWLFQHLRILLLCVFLILPVLSFLLASTAIMAYIFWPTDLSRITMPSIDPTAKNVVVLAHGLNDNPSSWSTDLKHKFKQRLLKERETSEVIALDWNPYSKSALRCSVHGKRIGAAIGYQMAESARLKSAHLIGHSCGAFVILGLCEALKAERSDIQIQTSYLAPVNIYGGIFWNYGSSHFGRCASFSDAYFDREDTIGENRATVHSYSFDITDARKKLDERVSPHIWPTIYYRQLVESGLYPNLRNYANLPKTFIPEDLKVVKDTRS